MRDCATRTTDELDFLHLALIGLLFHVLGAFREPLRLCGVRFPALVDLRDGAGVEICDGLREVARGGFIRGKVEIYRWGLGRENGGKVELARS